MNTVPIDLRTLSSRSSVPAITIEARRPAEDDLGVRLTWLAYAVALSSFGVMLGVGLGLLLVSPVPFVRL